MHIPHIISKLEHSKVIYTFRNPLDNILSLYRAKFTGNGHKYSSSLIDTATYYIHHFKIMWKKYVFIYRFNGFYVGNSVKLHETRFPFLATTGLWF